MSSDEIKQLRRSKSNRILAGICGGLGEYFGIDPVWFRLGFVLFSLPGGVPGVLLYIVCWILIQEE
ncbi:MAG: PspC domain-containing protein [Anaerolineales bacterium]